MGSSLADSLHAKLVNGFSGSAAGIAKLGVGSALVAYGADDRARSTFLVLLAGAAALWALAAAIHSRAAWAPSRRCSR